ncbi:aminoglycoside phosphotransferase family protein [Kribbella sp. NPDC048915]|uniref:phosphotransferase family protein n=1 Tax=Kribbella sp. NPDC048915 TaxID=3155148 RepID=UPI00340A4D6F
MTESRVRELVALGLPGYSVRQVVPLGAGLDNVAYEVNGELVVRIAREPGAVRREAALLEVLGEVSTLPVPAPVFVLPEHDCIAYRKLLGTPLIEVPPNRRSAWAAAVGAELGSFLSALHASDPDLWTDVAGVDDEPLAGWRDEAAELYADVAERLAPGQHRGVEDFLRAPLPDPAQTLVFSHNDLGIEHVLVAKSTGSVSGIIDWSDAAVCDPARDLGLILRDLGTTGFEAALERYPAGDDLRDRAWFYARCSLLEDLQFGLKTGRATYRDKSLIALGELFAPD